MEFGGVKVKFDFKLRVLVLQSLKSLAFLKIIFIKKIGVNLTNFIYLACLNAYFILYH